MQFTVNAQFMTALMIECYPMLAITPLATADNDVLITSLRFPSWPYNGSITMGVELKTATGFVLNKP